MRSQWKLIEGTWGLIDLVNPNGLQHSQHYMAVDLRSIGVCMCFSFGTKAAGMWELLLMMETLELWKVFIRCKESRLCLIELVRFEGMVILLG